MRASSRAGVMDEAIRHFVEDAGVHFESYGIPRMAGRIFGYLLVCNPPHQSGVQLAAALQVSKGSVSATLDLLQRIGMLERVPVPGQRSKYFRIATNPIESVMRSKVQALRDTRRLVEHGLELLADRPAAQRSRLAQMLDAYVYFERELPAMFDRYRQLHQEKWR